MVVLELVLELACGLFRDCNMSMLLVMVSKTGLVSKGTNGEEIKLFIQSGKAKLSGLGFNWKAGDVDESVAMFDLVKLVWHMLKGQEMLVNGREAKLGRVSGLVETRSLSCVIGSWELE